MVDETESFTFEKWAKYGWLKGWCSPPMCATHDGLPTSYQEEEQMFDGDDICIHIIRLYDDAQHASEIVDANSPVQWRATNQGWGRTEK